MNRKKIYTVKGSEDSIIGVYTSEKKAIKKAKMYLKNGGVKDIFLDYWENGEFYKASGRDGNGYFMEAVLRIFALNKY